MNAKHAVWISTGVLGVILLVVGVTWLSPYLNRNEGTAAWVQATGAILIIFATAQIANRNSRETQERERITKDQLWKTVATLARNSLDAIDGLLNKHPPRPPHSDTRGNFLRSYAPSDFQIPMDGLAAIPLHHLGDARLVTAVLNLRGVMGRMKSQLDEVLANQILSQTIEHVSAQRGLAFNAVASVLRIVEGNAAEIEISRLSDRYSPLNITAQTAG